MTLPVAPTEGKGNLEAGQTSIQPTGNIAGNTKLEVPGQTKLHQAGQVKPNQTNLPETTSPSSARSQTSLQKSAISDCYQHPTPSKSGGFSLNTRARIIWKGKSKCLTCCYIRFIFFTTNPFSHSIRHFQYTRLKSTFKKLIWINLFTCLHKLCTF